MSFVYGQFKETPQSSSLFGKKYQIDDEVTYVMIIRNENHHEVVSFSKTEEKDFLDNYELDTTYDYRSISTFKRK